MFERQIDQPLFPKILWNRPISRATAGRLLVVGGHQSGVALIQSTYQIAAAAGIGALTVLAPDALRSLLGGVPQIDYAPSTPSGSLARAALAQFIDASSYADTILLGIDASNNSETAILFESFITKFHQPLILADDALEVIAMTPDIIRDRPKTLLILSMQQLFKLAAKLRLPIQIRPDSGIAGKIEIVRDLGQVLKIDLALVGPEIIISVGEQASVTLLGSQPASLTAAALGTLSVFYTQNLRAHFEGLTTGAFLIKQAVESSDHASLADIAASLTKALDSHE